MISKMADVSDHINNYILEDKLVDLWGDYPCLFDVRSPEFKNRDKRQQALQEMAIKLDQTVDWVKLKLRLLRNSYTKAKRLQPSGSAKKNQSKRCNWLLEKLQFLAPHIAARPTLSNLNTSSTSINENLDAITDETDVEEFDDACSDDEKIQTNIEKDISATKSTKQAIKRPKSLKKKREEEEFDLMKGLAKSITMRETKIQKISKPDTAEDSYGRYISETLSNMDPATRNMAQFHINNIIFQAQQGTLNQTPHQYHHQSVPPRPPTMFSQQQQQQQFYQVDSQIDTTRTNSFDQEQVFHML